MKTVVAYCSDHQLLNTTLLPHGVTWFTDPQLQSTCFFEFVPTADATVRIDYSCFDIIRPALFCSLNVHAQWSSLWIIPCTSMHRFVVSFVYVKTDGLLKCRRM